MTNLAVVENTPNGRQMCARLNDKDYRYLVPNSLAYLVMKGSAYSPNNVCCEPLVEVGTVQVQDKRVIVNQPLDKMGYVSKCNKCGSEFLTLQTLVAWDYAPGVIVLWYIPQEQEPPTLADYGRIPYVAPPRVRRERYTVVVSNHEPLTISDVFDEPFDRESDDDEDED